MRRYDIRCEEGHYTEILMRLSEFTTAHTCSCGRPAKVVITKPAYFSVDNTDRRDYASVTGRNFSNRRELDAYLAENNAFIPESSDSTLKNMFDQRQQDIEERRMVESRGKNYEQFLKEKFAEQQSRKFSDLAANGVSIQSLTKEDAMAQGWSPTVNEADYMSPTDHGTTAAGTRWNRAQFPTTPVEEPVFE